MATVPGGEAIEGLDALTIKRASTAEHVAEALRAMILSGELEQGRALREVVLANTTGVSRNTMREAIRVLAREGLVTHHLHRGAIVTRLTERDVEDIFRVRRTVELAAVEATASASAEALGGLAQAVDQLAAAAAAMDSGAVIDADRLFHERLVGILGSQRLDRFFDAIQAEMRLCMSIVDRRDLEEGDRLVAEHRELLALIEAGEVERCAEVMAGHLADSERMLKQIVAGDPGPEPPRSRGRR
jgi:DNA-binding GntR family transcriptional regulator